jgi:hypothetical protein
VVIHIARPETSSNDTLEHPLTYLVPVTRNGVWWWVRRADEQRSTFATSPSFFGWVRCVDEQRSTFATAHVTVIPVRRSVNHFGWSGVLTNDVAHLPRHCHSCVRQSVNHCEVNRLRVDDVAMTMWQHDTLLLLFDDHMCSCGRHDGRRCSERLVM